MGFPKGSPKLIVHLRDKATDTFVEIDGERIETTAVQAVTTPDGPSHVLLYLDDVEVIDERSGV